MSAIDGHTYQTRKKNKPTVNQRIPMKNSILIFKITFEYMIHF